jgi:glycosyltransferase involved in cell wall biosynthesis
MKTLSVIVPTLNEAKYVRETLQGLTMQSYRNFELIVKDGLSSDTTVEVAEAYADKVISQQDISIGDARNQAARHATGDVLVFLDADTHLNKNALELVAEDFSKYNVVLLLPRYGPREHGDDPLSYTKKEVSRFLIGFENYWRRYVDRFCGGMFMPTECAAFKRVGGFDRRIKCCEDIELSYRLRNIGNVLTDYRIQANFSIRRFILSGFIRTLRDYGVNALRMHLHLLQPEFESFR